MDQLIEFATNHPFLVSLFFILLFLLIQTSLSSASGIKSVSPFEATSLVNHENAIIIDIRESTEFDKGHILNSLHIPPSSINDQLNKLKKNVDKPVIVSCNSGHRSRGVCKQLLKNGLTKVYNLDGGILAWQNANMPISKI